MAPDVPPALCSSVTLESRLTPGGRLGSSEQLGPATSTLMWTLGLDPRRRDTQALWVLLSPLLILPAAHADLRPVVGIAAVLLIRHRPPLWNRSQPWAPPGLPVLALRPRRLLAGTDPLLGSWLTSVVARRLFVGLQERPAGHQEGRARRRRRRVLVRAQLPVAQQAGLQEQVEVKGQHRERLQQKQQLLKQGPTPTQRHGHEAPAMVVGRYHVCREDYGME